MELLKNVEFGSAKKRKLGSSLSKNIYFFYSGDCEDELEHS
jgi:hypothetical protein